jgi:hypothetical protein
MDRRYVWLAVYLAAAAVYVTLGVFFPRILLSWVEGTVFLLVTAVAVPAFFGLRR